MHYYIHKLTITISRQGTKVHIIRLNNLPGHLRIGKLRTTHVKPQWLRHAVSHCKTIIHILLTKLRRMIDTGNGSTFWRFNCFQRGSVVIFTACSVGKCTGDFASGFTQCLHLTRKKESAALWIGSLDIHFIIEGLFAVIYLKGPRFLIALSSTQHPRWDGEHLFMPIINGRDGTPGKCKGRFSCDALVCGCNSDSLESAFIGFLLRYETAGCSFGSGTGSLELMEFGF